MLNNLDFRINWLLTLWINFTKLPFSQARKLPIFIYGWHSEVYINKLILDIPSENLNFAMIKIGCMFDVCTWSHYGCIIHTKGCIILKGACVIGRGFSYWGSRRSELVLGANAVINGHCSIHCKEKIQIGKNFSCGWNVSISDTDFHQCRNMDNDKLCSESSEIIIGNYVWVGQHCIIAKNSEVSDWTIISQSSLLNKKYICDPYHILAGSPAKVIINKRLRREDLYKQSLIVDSFIITKGFRLFNIE